MTNLPTADLNTAEIARGVSQSELIEPLGTKKMRTMLEMPDSAKVMTGVDVIDRGVNCLGI